MTSSRVPRAHNRNFQGPKHGQLRAQSAVLLRRDRLGVDQHLGEVSYKSAYVFKSYEFLNLKVCQSVLDTHKNGSKRALQPVLSSTTRIVNRGRGIQKSHSRKPMTSPMTSNDVIEGTRYSNLCQEAPTLGKGCTIYSKSRSRNSKITLPKLNDVIIDPW